MLIPISIKNEIVNILGSSTRLEDGGTLQIWSDISEIRAKPLRLHVENFLSYNENFLDGLLDLSIINKSKKINYNFKNNILNFETMDNNIEGNIYIKPFFLSTIVNFPIIDLKKNYKR